MKGAVGEIRSIETDFSADGSVPSRPRRPVAIDLFSGAGGLSLGFETAGFDVLSAIEYDPVHAATHLYNFPLTDVLCADVAALTAEDLLSSAERGWSLHHPDEPWDGVVDAIVGGPSCQGFSTMGRQDASDERNQLIFEFVRLVVEVRPRAFCMENVPGFLDRRFDGIRAKAFAILRQAGYVIIGEDSALKAEEFGVPQKRRRVVILGVLGESDLRSPIPSYESPFTVADAFSGLPAGDSHALPTDSDLLELDDEWLAKRSLNQNEYIRQAGILGIGNEDFGYARVIDVSKLSGCRAVRHSAASIRRFAATEQGTKERISRYYKLSPAAPALTLRAGTGRERGAFSAARPLHPTAPRVITVREAARLHSFPDWFRFHTTNWHAHRQIGNAVPPLLARAAAASLIEALRLVPESSTRAPIPFGHSTLLELSPTEAARYFSVSETQVPKRTRVLREATLTLPPNDDHLLETPSAAFQGEAVA